MEVLPKVYALGCDKMKSFKRMKISSGVVGKPEDGDGPAFPSRMPDEFR
jgi:hypothetical protein